MAVSVTITSEERWQRRKETEHYALQEHAIGYNETTNTNKTSVHWQRVKYQPLNFYPTVPLDETLKPTRLSRV
ncbi:hypothetical protein VP01_3088g1 [Puccinia sorghi]|uniref:Uncharacterized protein n=1 Tax=Puccinia sorghi TaxID=27349 RepID=A0A0L6UZJ9_9BASI|nr:hypothetical protein VP01_3088g1 [Puccinia sorghi]